MSDDSAATPLRANAAFRLYWLSDTVSELGSAVSLVAFPLLAVILLHASTLQVGVLVAAENIGWLVVALPAGALVEGWDRRRVLIVCDVLRAVVTVWVPIAYALGVLTLVQLVLVAGTVGTISVVASVAVQAFLPAVVPRSQLVEANGRIQTTSAAAGVVGPGVGGLLVQLLTAAGTISIDAASFALSGLAIARMPRQSHHIVTMPAARQRPLRHQVREGLVFVFGTPRFRWLTLCGVQWNLMVAAQEALVVPFLVRTVHVRSAAVGLLLATAGVGGILGGLVSKRLGNHIGPGRSAVAGLAFAGASSLLIPLTSRGPGLALFAAGNLGTALGATIFGVMNGSFRQAACPPELLSRMAASTRLFTWGALAVGGLLGGYLGSLMGARSALYAVVGGYLLSPLWLVVTTARSLDTPTPG
ncbi:MAG: MFS transporter [Acidimicrobiales bacterium]